MTKINDSLMQKNNRKHLTLQHWNSLKYVKKYLQAGLEKIMIFGINKINWTFSIKSDFFN